MPNHHDQTCAATAKLEQLLNEQLDVTIVPVGEGRPIRTGQEFLPHTGNDRGETTVEEFVQQHRHLSSTLSRSYNSDHSYIDVIAREGCNGCSL